MLLHYFIPRSLSIVHGVSPLLSFLIWQIYFDRTIIPKLVFLANSLRFVSAFSFMCLLYVKCLLSLLIVAKWFWGARKSPSLCIWVSGITQLFFWYRGDQLEAYFSPHFLRCSFLFGQESPVGDEGSHCVIWWCFVSINFDIPAKVIIVANGEIHFYGQNALAFVQSSAP